MGRRHCSASSSTFRRIQLMQKKHSRFTFSLSIPLSVVQIILSLDSFPRISTSSLPFLHDSKIQTNQVYPFCSKNAFILFHFLCDTLSTLCDYRSEKQRKLDQKSFSRKSVQVSHLLQLLYPQHLAPLFVANSLIALYQAHSRPSIIFKLPKGLIPSLASWVKTGRKKL